MAYGIFLEIRWWIRKQLLRILRVPIDSRLLVTDQRGLSLLRVRLLSWIMDPALTSGEIQKTGVVLRTLNF